MFFAALITGCEDPNGAGNLVPRLVTEDSSLPALQINGSRFHLETMGNPDNPVIIMLHGGPGNDYRYMLNLAERHDSYSLSDDYFLVFWDQRGSGLSERHGASKLTLKQYLSDLEHIIDHFALGRKVILLGHSWGGEYAAMYMNAHPDRVSGVIMVEPGPFSTKLEEKMEGTSRPILSEAVSDMLWIRQFVSMEDHNQADYAYMMVLGDPQWNEKRKDKGSQFWRVGAAVLRFVYLDEMVNKKYDFTANLDKVEPEVLFVVGGESIEMGDDFQKKYQMPLFRKSRLEVVPGSGHGDTVDYYADITVAFIHDYLNDMTAEGYLK